MGNLPASNLKLDVCREIFSLPAVSSATMELWIERWNLGYAMASEDLSGNKR
jgi:hypothetical protein